MHIPTALNTLVCPATTAETTEYPNILFAALNISTESLQYLQSIIKGTPTSVDSLFNDFDVDATIQLYGIKKEELLLQQHDLSLRERVHNAVLVRIGSK
jgi:hypothetical protein